MSSPKGYPRPLCFCTCCTLLLLACFLFLGVLIPSLSCLTLCHFLYCRDIQPLFTYFTPIAIILFCSFPRSKHSCVSPLVIYFPSIIQPPPPPLHVPLYYPFSFLFPGVNTLMSHPMLFFLSPEVSSPSVVPTGPRLVVLL